MGLGVTLVASERRRCGGEPSGAKYEEGTATENTVSSVRFYFFDANGNPANVKLQTGGGFKNFADVDNTTAGDKNMPNVEKKLTATIVINTQAGDLDAPKKIFAVLNPDKTALGSESLSLAALREMTADYVPTASSNFVMANSAYIDAANNNVYATDIAGKIYSNETAATTDPVIMYVERNVAKVRLQYGTGTGAPTPDANGCIALNDKDGNTIKATVDNTEHDVLLKVTGWNVTATTNPALTEAAVTEQLQIIGSGKLWKEGKTYYYTEIQHLNNGANKTKTDVGYYGVVRNHVYELSINKIAGLGTLVYKPDETIWPEIPEQDYSYIAAEINILSWRYVPSGVELVW